MSDVSVKYPGIPGPPPDWTPAMRMTINAYADKAQRLPEVKDLHAKATDEKGRFEASKLWGD